jgi:hypothetical protein
MALSDIFNQAWQTVIVRFIVNFTMVLILGRLLYHHRKKGKIDFLFTYVSVSIIIFIICSILSQVPVELGFALGLFAIFSVIHFRSIQVTPRELSYLFVALGMAILNSLSPHDVHIIRLIINNMLILITVGLVDYFLFRKKKTEKNINYDRLDLLHEEKTGELKQDLETRFGIKNITHIQIGDIDTLKSRVRLKIRFDDNGNRHFTDQ